MSSKWGDAACEALSFDQHSRPSETDSGNGSLPNTRSLFYALMVHRFSLLHALACSHLRREVTLGEAAEVSPTLGGSRYQEQKLLRNMRAAAKPLGSCCVNFFTV